MRVHVQASGYIDVNAATAAFTVEDAESLSITLDAASMSEKGGRAQATVRRSNTDLGLPLIVSVTSSDLTEASVPASVTIPAGQASMTFAVSAEDDTLLDGVQLVSVHVQATGYIDVSAATASLGVEDAESLSITLDAASMSEKGGRVQATITRSNTDLSNSQVVNLTSRDTSEATVPSQLRYRLVNRR